MVSFKKEFLKDAGNNKNAFLKALGVGISPVYIFLQLSETFFKLISTKFKISFVKGLEAF